MKLLVCLFLFLIPTLNYGFKKHELPYSIIIAKADLIVDGTISKVSKNEYEFTISQFVKGKSSAKIKVSIWKEWLCDPRIKELKTGQRLILFLEKTAYGNFSPINGSTGEIYVDNDSFINIFLPKDFSTPEILKKGISMFLRTCTFYGDINDRFLQNVYLESTKSIFEICKMKQENSAFNYLVGNGPSHYALNEIPAIFLLN
ncbi:hypothetical protein GKZ90_0006920 [Flavobacterium sp. MC2016-06]|jgi:hypothetical protein|uniref:hypothetical protein n=1 Tax=Flavobacterium sp. MC2016-06 TaxID=2676308 RepID=UPI0012BA94C9|nr:hypothetical protein [Flavobacterium sp. MC2016-06]MBU3857872.1 hypothetical protein [Flavobacterium sp. MC2016-06]